MATANSQSRPLWLKALSFALAYIASAEGSWFLSSRYGSDVIFWIPAGLIVAVLLLTDHRDWPALFAAGAVGNMAFDLRHATPFGMSVVYAGVNVVQAGIGAYLFHRFVSRKPRLNVIREFLGLVVFSAVISATFIALLTSIALVFTGDSESFAKSFALGWLGNAMAILTVAPFVVIWFRPRGEDASPWLAPRKIPEAALLAVGLVIAADYLFVGGRGVLAPANFILVPFVLWAALRFGIRGASAVNFLLALLLVFFASHFPKEADAAQAMSGAYLIQLYGFLAICALVGLIPAIAIAERDMLVGQLGDSEERFRKLATAASEGVVITEDGVVIDVNDQALRLFGYDSVDEMVGLNAADFISPETRTLVAEAVAAGEDVTYENKLTRRDGSGFHAEVQSKMMPFGDRRILMTAVRDISERKKAELLLNGQFQVLEMIAAGRPLGEILATLVRVIETQSDGMVGAVLQKEGGLLRLVVAPSLTEAHRRSIETIEIADGGSGSAAAAFKLEPVFIGDIATDCPASEHTRLLLGLGLRAWWSAPILDGKQRLIGAFILYHRQAGLPSASQRQLIDIATHTTSVAMSRHRDEAALKLSDFSVNQASTPTFWVTQDSRIRRVNRAACEMTGHSESELLSMVVPDLIQGISKAGWNDTWMETRLSRSRTFESEHTHRDGHVILLEVDMNWFEFEGREYLFVYLHDITERRQLEDKLRQSQKMEAIGQLSGGIAHDFNNLLTVIQGNLGIMRISGSFTQEIVELVDEIANAIDRATKLTGQLLAFGRKQVMQSADVDLNAVVDGFTRMLRRVIGDAIDLQINFSASGLPVRADSSMLEQAMLNLCLNSRDAMPVGGRLTLSTATVTIGPEKSPQSNASRAGKFARLSVTDTGVGISPENIKHVFEPFFTTKAVGKGTGLGLASVYGIIQQHNGWVSVHSELGQGTTFNIYLPLLARAAMARPPGKASAAVPRGNETILLVEDDVAVRLVTTKALGMMGYRVLVASDGVEAIALWNAHRSEIQLLLTDMVMPGGYGGAEIARIFTAQDPSLKVIFMSGYSADLAGTDISATSGGYFLGKPFEIAELASTLRSCLSGVGTLPKRE
jgi:PAS domain S-box-containing protein